MIFLNQIFFNESYSFPYWTDMVYKYKLMMIWSQQLTAHKWSLSTKTIT